MLKMSAHSPDVKRLEKALGKAAKNLGRELKGVVNAGIKACKKDIAKQVSGQVAIKQKDVQKQIRVSKQPSNQKTSGEVRLGKSSRIPLRDFGAKQNSKGVSYKIDKTAGRKTAIGAFQGPRPGVMKASWKGNVFKRVGKDRLPIVKLMAISSWGVYVKNDMTKDTTKAINEAMKKEIDRRIRKAWLVESGVITGKGKNQRFSKSAFDALKGK